MQDLDQDLLIRNGFIDIVVEPIEPDAYRVSTSVATIVSNLATYGFTLDRRALDALIDHQHLERWWKQTERVLQAITGADRNMGEFMVYKNFPREVLDMDRATQVFHQILIYLGVPHEKVAQPEIVRPALGDVKRLKMLTLADAKTPLRIYDNLLAMPNRWNDNQGTWAEHLVGGRNAIVFADFAFKENAVALAAARFADIEIGAGSATDVMRLAAGLSTADVSLRQTVKFRHFKRAERRRLLALLEAQTDLAADFASRPGPWKRLMEHLRPGDYIRRSTGEPVFPRVGAAYDDLYNRYTLPFSAQIAPKDPTPAVLDALVTRPGEFLRRFHHVYGLFGSTAVDRFLPIMDKLSTRQLVGLRAYLRTINDRFTLISPPRSNWARAKVRPNTKTKIEPKDRFAVDARISEILRGRLAQAFPEGVALDLRVDQIKLQTNDQKLAEYGRGTVFDIPPEVTFIRSASYWACEHHGVTWYDNGWNFFGDSWIPMGTCGWDAQHFPQEHGHAAIFSGDPVNINDLKGRACQMADLYLDKLDGLGVRYAVWNILCYSKKKFSEATDVLATLQWGENAETGRTYEPSRAQMVFPLKSETYASYVAYIDVKRRKLVYMDVALRADVMNTEANATRLQEIMPAYVEYLDALPTVLEILQDAPSGEMPVLLDDRNVAIEGGRAFVFRPERANNTFERVTVTDLTAL